jgi:hypothetical protein
MTASEYTAEELLGTWLFILFTATLGWYFYNANTCVSVPVLKILSEDVGYKIWFRSWVCHSSFCLFLQTFVHSMLSPLPDLLHTVLRPGSCSACAVLLSGILRRILEPKRKTVTSGSTKFDSGGRRICTHHHQQHQQGSSLSIISLPL